MKIVSAIGKFVGVTAAVWIGYNMLIFASVASGARMAYVPYLNFPIKVLVAFLS